MIPDAKAYCVPWNLTRLWLFLTLVIDLDFCHLNRKGDFELLLKKNAALPIGLPALPVGFEIQALNRVLFLMALGFIMFVSVPVPAQVSPNPDDPCARVKSFIARRIFWRPGRP